MISLKIIIRAVPVMLAAAAMVMPGISWAKDPINADWLGVAIKGYDTVAYFTEGKPVKGDKMHEFTWKGAKWRFSTAAHRQMFAADPEKYAPRYGGY